MPIRILLVFAGLVLVAAAGTQVYFKFFQQTVVHFADFEQPSNLFEGLPAELQVQEVPIASTQSAIAAVEGILRPTAMTYYEISDGRHSVFVWIATWAPKTMSPWEVFSHTPDNCWVYAGGEIKELANGEPFSVYPEMLSNAQRRAFDMGGNRIEVIWWHLLGGEVFTSLDSGVKNLSILDRLRSFADYQLEFRQGEQTFVRIHSEGSLEEILSSGNFDPLMERLQALFVLPEAEEAGEQVASL